MTPEPYQLIGGPGAPKPRPSWMPIIVTIISAIVLAMGSCFGFVITLQPQNRAFNSAFSTLFLLCVVAFFGGVIWAFVRLIKNSRRR
jgi:flagellar biogenesis protein FliO